MPDIALILSDIQLVGEATGLDLAAKAPGNSAGSDQRRTANKIAS